MRILVEKFISIILIVAYNHNELSEVSGFRNHCAGISSYLLWEINSTTTITMKVNTSNCTFAETPLYFVSLNGAGNHFCLTGYGAIYLSTKQSFQIYAQYECSLVNSIFLWNLTQRQAYNINWLGFYKYNS